MWPSADHAVSYSDCAPNLTMLNSVEHAQNTETSTMQAPLSHFQPYLTVLPPAATALHPHRPERARRPAVVEAGGCGCERPAGRHPLPPCLAVLGDSVGGPHADVRTGRGGGLWCGGPVCVCVCGGEWRAVRCCMMRCMAHRTGPRPARPDMQPPHNNPPQSPRPPVGLAWPFRLQVMGFAPAAAAAAAARMDPTQPLLGMAG